MRSLASWRRAWRRARRDAPAKVAAVVAALGLWWVATNDPGTTVQRSLLVPLRVDGAAADEVAVGVPDRVEVVVSGPSERMDRLDADDVDASLDLTGVDGAFAADVEARVPQALRVVRVVPAEVIGRLEAVRRATFDVGVVLPAASGDADAAWRVASLAPATVIVEARDPVLADVDAVVAVLRDGDAARRAVDAPAPVPLVALDADARPVVGARLSPTDARLRVRADVPWRSVRREVRVLPLPEGVRLVELATAEATVVAPLPTLADLPDLPAAVPEATAAWPPGTYDVTLVPDAPDDVAVATPLRATVRIGADDAPAGP
ncbi:MAG: CdaR family protein [Trueperaceae bacterium]|nr:CdaR family protein [Trueperaceae bacterium]